MSFDEGLVLGLVLGAGKATGSVADPDLALWQSLPEPENNQTIFVFRVTDINFRPVIQVATNYTGIEEDLFHVDWGDETQESFTASGLSNISHSYSAAGIYTVVCTADNINVFPAWRSISNMLIMAKYGETVLLENEWNSNAVGGTQYLKYIKISSFTDLSGGSYFSSCFALRKIIYKGQAVNNIPANTFAYCYVLDLSDWDFSAVQNVGNYAFTLCTNIKKINMPLCSSVGSSAFNGCYNLITAQFADECTFGSNAFQACYSLYPIPS